MNTTLNIHFEIFNIITAAAQTHSISPSAMIIRLMKKVVNDTSKPHRKGTMVRYQRTCEPDAWRIIHITLRPDDYEYLLDLRKILKMSVSLILAYAVRKYLNNNEGSFIDNYQYNNYKIIRKVKNSIVSWEFIWGNPPDLKAYR